MAGSGVLRALVRAVLISLRLLQFTVSLRFHFRLKFSLFTSFVTKRRCFKLCARKFEWSEMSTASHHYSTYKRVHITQIRDSLKSMTNDVVYLHLNSDLGIRHRLTLGTCSWQRDPICCWWWRHWLRQSLISPVYTWKSVQRLVILVSRTWIGRVATTLQTERPEPRFNVFTHVVHVHCTVWCNVGIITTFSAV